MPTRLLAQRRRKIINYPYSLNFPGSNGNHMHVGTNIYAPERDQSWGIGYWILPKNNNVSNAHIFSEIDSTLPYRGRIIRSTGGLLYVWLINTFNTNECYANYKMPPIGFWSRVMHGYNGNSNSSGITTYINGVLQTQNAVRNLLSATIVPTAASTRWGGWSGIGGNYPMYLNTPTYLDYCPTAEDAADDYYDAVLETPPLDIYGCTEGSLTSVASQGVGNHTATLVGSVTWSPESPMKSRSTITQNRIALS